MRRNTAKDVTGSKFLEKNNFVLSVRKFAKEKPIESGQETEGKNSNMRRSNVGKNANFSPVFDSKNGDFRNDFRPTGRVVAISDFFLLFCPKYVGGKNGKAS